MEPIPKPEFSSLTPEQAAIIGCAGCFWGNLKNNGTDLQCLSLPPEEVAAQVQAGQCSQKLETQPFVMRKKDKVPSANKVRTILKCDTCSTPIDAGGCPTYEARVLIAQSQRQNPNAICPDHSESSPQI